MFVCEFCQEDVENPLFVEYSGKRYPFDSFDCAIQKMANRCHSCGSVNLASQNERFCSEFCKRKGDRLSINDEDQEIDLLAAGLR